jgi:hypothetical protein
MRGIIAIPLLLMLAGPSVYSQSGTDVAQPSPAPSLITSLNGNWNISGNRKKEQFPLLSMFFQVSGTQIIAHGDVEVRCPNDPRNGGGVKAGWRGKIAPDGSFVLRNNGASDTTQWEIQGRVPPEGGATWSGDYTLTRPASRNCPAFQQTNSFTATPLAPLDGTFSGSLAMRYFKPPPPNYNGPQSFEATFNVTVAQGTLVSYKLKSGDVAAYLPLIGTIRVKGSPCFSHGVADLVTESTHGAAPGSPSTLGGDFVNLRFAMNDESQLNLHAVFADPGESALLVTDATVIGGKCENQTFQGTLERR